MLGTTFPALVVHVQAEDERSAYRSDSQDRRHPLPYPFDVTHAQTSKATVRLKAGFVPGHRRRLTCGKIRTQVLGDINEVRRSVGYRATGGD